jgi:Alpha/beta hydrolase family
MLAIRIRQARVHGWLTRTTRSVNAMLERPRRPRRAEYQIPGGPVNDEVEFTADGDFVVRAETAVGCFYNECDRGEAEHATRRLRPTAAACVAMPTGTEPWKSIPSTYVLCARDRAIYPDSQRRMSTRAGEVVTLDTNHSPFMSSPEQFGDLLDGSANKADANAGIT